MLGGTRAAPGRRDRRRWNAIGRGGNPVDDSFAIKARINTN